MIFISKRLTNIIYIITSEINSQDKSFTTQDEDVENGQLVEFH